MAEGMTATDAIALTKGDGMFGDNGAFWIFALLLLAGGNFGFGGGRENYVTSAELQASQNAQTTALQFQSLNNALADQTAQIIQQNNTNLINAIQGFNSLGLQITNQTNVLASKLDGLSAQMASCCCEIKTQMLQDRLADTQAKLVTAQNAIDNANQSQYLLSQMGKWVANPSATA